MTNERHRFELIVLRPLQVVFLLAAVAFAFQGKWLALAACALGLIWLGFVGSSLHPLQPISELMQGPLNGPGARKESEALSPDKVRAIVDKACTSIGILLGLASGALLWNVGGLSWYFATPLAFAAMLLTGAALKLVFKTV
jgi:hypothetical protein